MFVASFNYLSIREPSPDCLIAGEDHSFAQGVFDVCPVYDDLAADVTVFVFFAHIDTSFVGEKIVGICYFF